MKKSPRKTPKKRRKSPALVLTMLLVLVMGGFLGRMHLQAGFTHLKPAQVYLPDLPASFENTKILYISDFKLKSKSDADAAARLMRRLAQLEPDILLLGGDYCAHGVLETLNGISGSALPDYVSEFIASLAAFPAPMGKFAVSGDSDGDLQTLAAAFNSAGVTCLADSGVDIHRNGEKITVAGLTDRNSGRDGSSKLSRSHTSADCVIAIAHNPASYIDIRVSEAKGGGAWADLVLSGHTLGGQISIFGRTMRSFTDEEKRTMSGWYYPNDLPLLVSEGLGCDGVPLRLGSESQVHLLTLHKQNMIP